MKQQDKLQRISKISAQLHAEHACFQRSRKRILAAKALLREASEAHVSSDGRKLCKLLVRSVAWLVKPEDVARCNNMHVKRKGVRKLKVQTKVQKALIVCLEGLDFEDPGTRSRSDVQAVAQHLKGLLGATSLDLARANEEWSAISRLSESMMLKNSKDQVSAHVARTSPRITPPTGLDYAFSLGLPDGFTSPAPEKVVKKNRTKPAACPSTKAPTASARTLSAFVEKTVASLPKYSFVTDPGDHAETPFEAYQDVEAMLAGLADALHKSREQLSIWDPFFCQGAVKLHLSKLGFTNVHNANEDFYKVIASPDTIPVHDVLLSNPPFSKGHIDRILQFCRRNRKPWMLLMPSYVQGEPYYAKTLFEKRPNYRQRVMYMKPWKRYAYLQPGGLCKGHQRATWISPFESLWYISLYENERKVIAKWHNCPHKGGTLFETREQMLKAPDMGQIARTQHRANPRARKRAAMRRNSARITDAWLNDSEDD